MTGIKSKKALRLNRDTLRTLSAPDMRNVAGGPGSGSVTTSSPKYA